jgi:hypothetical protein
MFCICSNSRMASDRPASWRMPTPKQMEKLSLRQPAPRNDDPAPDGALPDEYWEALLRDPRVADKPRPPVEQMPLAKISREVLRVECRRCSRCVEIQRLDAIRLYGPMAVWKDVGQRLLDDGCRIRTGRHEEDGCWPDFSPK